MLRDRRLSDAEMIGKITHRVLAVEEFADQSKSSRVGEQLQDPDCLFDMSIVCVFNFMRIHAYSVPRACDEHVSGS